MRAWRISKAKRAKDLSGKGAAIEGGRWNDQDVPAVYRGLTPAICCLETFVHAVGEPTMPMKITCSELPDDLSLYLDPDPRKLPDGWASQPADRPSMDFDPAWLKANSHLGLIIPSAVLAFERNIAINPNHPALSQIRVIDVFDFIYDALMFK
ncbi:RES family NAD+ phosphorylase [Pseudomonas granadensis]|uniref:RES family NAD+ phosphorylase n=1 Tax=Pseudomonas granadensis TaxID=1421430 RepID=UPI0019D2EE01|nr:RES family NAD+ phosphorylase [Pseudomonas granadensis]MBN6774255.1 RES family NAD+ phosphorylase [Pseudomonas granadensis]MBN6805271.1 RES family NAD+ phosphorylase [Pseudomonas granadensis]MBN6832281.1 RES family NAD+ phosphorylase [Pseudomonas granadensis]MBN6839465.1 RES family NAD+ phosphorylase [Pseudomonas granadensis]MBN6868704.1 RES family NAD+ phosphorylase [Pseudomonas granadensis]